MPTKQNPTPNDQRSVTKNPNNPAHEADRVNREAQRTNKGQPTAPPKAR